MSLSIFSKNNERIAQGLTYHNFTTLARAANDNARTGGSIGDRTIRLTKGGKGIAFGATGHSGVSCAKSVDGSIGYLNPGTTAPWTATSPNLRRFRAGSRGTRSTPSPSTPSTKYKP